MVSPNESRHLPRRLTKEMGSNAATMKSILEYARAEPAPRTLTRRVRLRPGGKPEAPVMSLVPLLFLILLGALVFCVLQIALRRQ
jgi:hypothetical protein